MPTSARWWTEAVQRYVDSRRGVSEGWRKQTGRALNRMVYPCGRGRRIRPVFERIGFTSPTHHSDVTPRMVEALRDSQIFSSMTRQNWLSRLRGFLLWNGNPIAGEVDLWKFGQPKAMRRPYVALDVARTIMNAAIGRERVVVALSLLNGLRPVETSRLRVRDLEMDPRCPMMRVIGKGRHGGKERRIPINPLAYVELVPFVEGRRGEDPVYPGTYTAIDHDWRRILDRAGLPQMGLYALRRSFGRISHDAGVPIEEIQAIYGHSSPATTAYYIGVEETRMAAALERLAAAWARPE